MRRILSLALLISLIACLAAVGGANAASRQPTKSKKPVKKPVKTVTVKVPTGWPKTLRIDRIGVKASVESLALTKKSDTEAPYKWGDVAWFDRGVKPGDKGRAIIYGHLDSTCCPAVFWHLSWLKPGDIVQVQYKSGTMKFKVMWNHTYPDNKFPEAWLTNAAAKERGLSLVTCAGVFHKNSTGYDHRQAVYARLLLPNGKLG